MNVKDSWYKYFSDNNLWSKINKLISYCYSRNIKTFPEKENVLRVFELIDFEKVNVVIIGQDPYPGEGFADGIAFSSFNNGKRPASLTNIFKELKNDLGIERQNNDLSDWVKQGVLLLNTSLTVLMNDAGSDLNIGWEEIILQILIDLYKNNNNIIFCLWGNFAKSIFEKTKIVTNKIIESYHPSPLGYRGFKDSKPFSKINNFLLKVNKPEIKW